MEIVKIRYGRSVMQRLMLSIATCLIVASPIFFTPGYVSADDSSDRIFFYSLDHDGDMASISPDSSSFTLLGPLSEYGLSSNGSNVVYTNGSNVFVKNISTGVVTNITSGSGIQYPFFSRPIWSPDGTKIMFTTQGGDFNGDFKIYTISPNGSNVHMVTSSSQDGNMLGTSWSPDSSKILMIRFPADKPAVGFQVVDLNGQIINSFSNGDESWDQPSWSPDGTRIAFLRGVNGYQQEFIDVINLDGTGRQDIYSADQDHNTEAPVWAPDSDRLVYLVADWRNNNNNQLVIQSVSGSSPRRVLYSGVVGDPIQWWDASGANADATPPVPSTPVWSQNPKPTTGTTTLTVPATDDNSGIQKAEYFIGDTDPGQGNGATMQLSNVQNGGLSANLTTTFGADFPTGVYKISVRAQDNAGNWSGAVSDYLVVYDPAGPKMTGKRTIVPSLANGDILPGLTTTGQTDKAQFGFSVKYNNQSQINGNSDLQFSYSTGTHCNNPNKAVNCHDLSVNATNISWLVMQGTNNSIGIFQGTAAMAVDGQASTVLFRVTGVDGQRLSPTATDQFKISIYASNANPNTDAPIYQVNAADIARGNIKIQ